MTSHVKTAAIGFGSGMLGAALMLGAAGAAPKAKAKAVRVPDVIAAKEFRLLGEDGSMKGSWHAEDGNVTLSFMDGNDGTKTRVMISSTSDGSAVVGLGSKPGATAAMAVLKDARPGVSITGPSGRITIGTGDKGLPGLEAADKDGKVLFQSSK